MHFSWSEEMFVALVAVGVSVLAAYLVWQHRPGAGH